MNTTHQAVEAAERKYPTIKLEDLEVIEIDSDQPDGTFALVPLSHLPLTSDAGGGSITLPPLPRPDIPAQDEDTEATVNCYSDEILQEYARSAVRLNRAALTLPQEVAAEVGEPKLNWRKLVGWWEIEPKEWDDLKSIVIEMFAASRSPAPAGVAGGVDASWGEWQQRRRARPWAPWSEWYATSKETYDRALEEQNADGEDRCVEVRHMSATQAQPSPHPAVGGSGGVGGWQPIETAPFHKRILLAWTGREPVTGQWSEDDHFDCRPKGWVSPEHGWKGDGDQCIPRNQEDCTHWMPVPANPAPKQGAAK